MLLWSPSITSMRAAFTAPHRVHIFKQPFQVAEPLWSFCPLPRQLHSKQPSTPERLRHRRRTGVSASARSPRVTAKRPQPPSRRPRKPSSKSSNNHHATRTESASNTSTSSSLGDEKAKIAPIPKFMQRPASRGALSNVGTITPVINWYPGHIAKAERSLKESIKLVDVVIEVRDIRIPISTAHPSVDEWVGTRKRLLALTRADLVSEEARAAWRAHFHSRGENARFVDARHGRGVKELKKLAVEAGASVNEKRKSRGLLPRPVRCLVMGFPNVGKSAVINKLVGRNTAKSANKPGVTRNFQWIRISDSIELLDMPGIIPAKFVTQEKAIRLAICDDIGQAAYDFQIVASLMIDELKRITSVHPGYFDFSVMEQRFGISVGDKTGEEVLHKAAEQTCQGDLERAAMRLLTEFRSGILGPVALESPDMLVEGDIDKNSPNAS